MSSHLEDTELDRETRPHRPGSWRLSNIISLQGQFTLAASRMYALSKTNYNFLHSLLST